MSWDLFYCKQKVLDCLLACLEGGDGGGVWVGEWMLCVVQGYKTIFKNYTIIVRPKSLFTRRLHAHCRSLIN